MTVPCYCGTDFHTMFLLTSKLFPRVVNYLPLQKSAKLSVALAALYATTVCDDPAPTKSDATDLPAYWLEKQGEHSYLESVLGEQALQWVKEENAKTVSTIGDPTTKPLYSRLLSILTNKDKIPHVVLIGKHYYNFWQDSANPRGLLRRCSPEAYRAGRDSNSTVWETVLDVDALGKAEGESWVYKGSVKLDDGTEAGKARVLLMLSRGGADATVYREFNLVSKDFVKVEIQLAPSDARPP